ncbi:MAG: hypothetical protein ACJA0I_001693 [Gammaproteobacteria bacterium]|jgi:hypothetical protein
MNSEKSIARDAKLSATEGELNFPAPPGNDWKIGDSFDVFNGKTTGVNAFFQSITNGFDSEHSDSKTLMIYTDEECDSASEYQASVKGSGWGCTVKANAESEQISTSSSTSVVMMGSAYQFGNGIQVNTTAQTLSDEAQQLLSQSPADFQKRYGTHFISSVTYGKSILAQWTEIFSSSSTQKAFSASLQASYSDGATSAQAQADMNTASTETCSSTNSFGSLSAAGYEAYVVIKSASDIDTAMTEFGKAPMGNSVVTVMVLPWSVLDNASNANDGSTFVYDDNIQNLGTEIDKLTQIADGGQAYLDSAAYAGKWQYDKVKAVVTNATNKANSLLNYAQKVMNGDSPSDTAEINSQISQNPDSGQLQSDFTAASNKFILGMYFLTKNGTAKPKDFLPNEGGAPSADSTENGDYITQINEPGVAFSWPEPNSENKGIIEIPIAAYHDKEHDSTRHMFVTLDVEDGTIRAQVHDTEATSALGILGVDDSNSIEPANATVNNSAKTSDHTVILAVQ